MRIGILTFHRAHNCGAMLQAWALRIVLERMGYSVEFPVCNHVGEPTGRWLERMQSGLRGLTWIRRAISVLRINALSIPGEDLARYRYKMFRHRYLPERTCEPKEFTKHYDCIIVGSDQVWSARHAKPWAGLFLGEGIPRELRLIAYAASYGDVQLSDEKLMPLKRALSRFAAVSVRESLVSVQLQAYYHGRIPVVLDPTLLLRSEDFDMLCKNVRPPREPYLFMYSVSNNRTFIGLAKQLARKLGVRAVITSVYQYSRSQAPNGLTYGVSPDRMVGYIKHATYVLADSFHATALSVIYGKQFLTIREREEDETALSRPGTLLSEVGLSDRIVTPKKSLDQMVCTMQKPVCDGVDGLKAKREESLTWLSEAIR